MEPKAIRDLAQLSDADFFVEVARGMRLVVANVRRLYDAAKALVDQDRLHPARVLSKVAEEEAGKFLILLDAVRCPRQPRETFATQLRHFNSHLAKGLYAKACGYRPVTLAELQGYIDLDREQFYLDGPNDVDWIFRNEIIDGRENALYVDYVRHDESHYWTDPADMQSLMSGAPEPSAIQLVRSMDDVGVAAADALATVADVWRPAPVNADTRSPEIYARNRETLEMLSSRGQLLEQPVDTFLYIVREWQFPMYSLNLSMIRNDIADLRERQRNWFPDGYV